MNCSKFQLFLLSFTMIANIVHAQWQTADSSIYFNGGNVGINTATPGTRLAVNGGVSIFSGLNNTNPRPDVNAGTIQGEIRGVSSNGWYPGDDGFLRLSAGGGGSFRTKSFIDLSGYTYNVPERYMNIVMGTSGIEQLRITYNGRVGIGTADPQSKLAVNGDIFATKVKVTQTGWPDYVFEPGYKLPSLQEMENYVRAHKHLPDVPSAVEVEKEGLDLGDMNKRLLQKIEELTLYIIDHDKKMAAMQGEVNRYSEAIKVLQEKIAQLEVCN